MRILLISLFSLGILGYADGPSDSTEPQVEVSEPTPDGLAKEHVDTKLGTAGTHSDIFLEETGTNGGTQITIVDGKVTADGETSDWRVIVSGNSKLVFAARVQGESIVFHKDEYESKLLKELVDRPKSKYARPLSDYGRKP